MERIKNWWNDLDFKSNDQLKQEFNKNIEDKYEEIKKKEEKKENSISKEELKTKMNNDLADVKNKYFKNKVLETFYEDKEKDILGRYDEYLKEKAKKDEEKRKAEEMER